MLQFLALLLGSGASYASGYRDVSRANQSYPIMAKYDKNGVLRYCDGKRAGKPVPGWAKASVPAKTEEGNEFGCAILFIIFVLAGILLFSLAQCSG
jgi:hypothetical protein